MNASFNPSTSSTPQSADMVNFFLTPAAMKADENNKFLPSQYTTMPTKIPQTAVEQGKETFNDKTKKSLLKINLFIKRLKWFNIFADTTATKAQKSSEINQKW